MRIRNIRAQVGYLAICLLLMAGCKKKEVTPPPRCIYDQPVFAEVSSKAALEEEAFSQFKSNPFFNLLWENLTAVEGAAWLQKIETQFPALVEKLNLFRENDSLGSPRVYPFGDIGSFSPSTLRLAAIAGDLQQRVGNLSHLRVVQIGADYGGLCKILHDLSPF